MDIYGVARLKPTPRTSDNESECLGNEPQSGIKEFSADIRIPKIFLNDIYKSVF